MLRVKMFSGDTQFDQVKVLEQEIDHWLENEQPTIRQVIQSSSAGQVVLTFLYDDSHRDVSTVPHEAYNLESDSVEADSTDDEPEIISEAELPY